MDKIAETVRNVPSGRIGRIGRIVQIFRTVLIVQNVQNVQNVRNVQSFQIFQIFKIVKTLRMAKITVSIFMLKPQKPLIRVGSWEKAAISFLSSVSLSNFGNFDRSLRC